MIISLLIIISLFLLTCYFFEDSCSFCKSVIGIFKTKQEEKVEKEPENKILNETIVSSASTDKKKTKKSVKKAVKKPKKKK